MVCVEARALHLLPQVGAAWMPHGTQGEVLTPGTKEKPELAGARPLATGQGLSCLGPRQNNGWFRELFTLLEATDPARQLARLDGVAEHYGRHTAKAVVPWCASHPRFEVLWGPTYCPRAHPFERGGGAVHDKCPRNPQRTRLRALVQDVEQHVQAHGPGPYQRSRLYDTPEGTAAVERRAAENQPQLAACVYESHVARFRIVDEAMEHLKDLGRVCKL